MTERNDRLRTQSELAFFGTVTASLSHELRNVLATIDEYAGLVGDLADAAGPEGSVKAPKVQSISERIALQVDRGKELSRRLNRFSHTVDLISDTFDLNEMAKETVELVRRLAYLKQVRLSVELADEAIMVTDDPFHCGHAIFLGVQLALETAAQQRSVAVTVATDRGCPTVRITSADTFDESVAPPDLAHALTSMTAKLALRVEWRATDGENQLVLFFPSE